MTDTTNTAALRAGLTEQLDHMECYGGKGWVSQEDIRSILNSLDQLEAERQRADDLVLHVNTQANMREKAEKERDGVVKSYNRVTDERNSALYEVAALKAKLANPVVLSDCSFEAVSHMAHWYSEGECVAWVSGAEHVKKQIVAAGFTVKGE
ncbi:hypothetical protein SRABI106_02336 [Rahnella aquatilis]|nr:hypothetical protein SRABI106_02336 [Rahnella aquatilis]